MATGDFFGNLKDKMRTMYNGFLYNGEEEKPRKQHGNRYAQGVGYQPRHQQSAEPMQEQNGDNVVDFGAYQQVHYQQIQQMPQQYQQGNPPVQQPPMPQAAPQPQYQSYQRPQQPPVSQQPQQPVQAPVQPEMQPQPPVNAQVNARVINARGMGDCRSAITLLRNGDAVIIVLENITDQAEQRRLVDTLSGACYSLTATITKISRYGVYLLAPQTVAVYADQVTNQMNGMPGRANPNQGYQPGHHGQRAAYANQQPVNNYAQPQQGFTHRTAAPEEAAQPFYAQPSPQAAQVPSFTAQPAGYGYTPDEARAL